MRPFSIAVFAAFTLSSIAFAARPVTVDDEMKFRSIVDVKIAPDGERVAYVVSTPNLPKDEHEGALHVVSARGGTPTRLGESIRIFNTPAPAPRLRWSPDGSTLALLAFAGDKPQVFAIPLSGSAPRALTDAPDRRSPGNEYAAAFLARRPLDRVRLHERKDRHHVVARAGNRARQRRCEPDGCRR